MRHHASTRTYRHDLSKHSQVTGERANQMQTISVLVGPVGVVQKPPRPWRCLPPHGEGGRPARDREPGVKGTPWGSDASMVPSRSSNGVLQFLPERFYLNAVVWSN